MSWLVLLLGLRAFFLGRLALAVHRDAAVGAVPRPQPAATGREPEREVVRV